MNKVLLFFIILFSTTNVIGLVISFMEEEFIILKDRKSFKEFTVLDFFVFPFLGVGGFIYYLSSKLSNSGNIFKVKPFKKTSFRVGEIVLYKDKECIVIETEKTVDGDKIKIEICESYVTGIVEVKDVRKISKLEKALK